MSLLGKEWYGEYIEYMDGYKKGFKVGYETAKKELEERKTAKWKHIHNCLWECTTEGCGKWVNIRTPYCAYCGAKMEVDE